MSFILRTVLRTVVSTAISAGVTLAVKKVVDSRTKRKPAMPRLTDGRAPAQRKPAQRAKSPDA